MINHQLLILSRFKKKTPSKTAYNRLLTINKCKPGNLFYKL